MTTSLLKFPGLFPVFWLILMRLLSGWSSLISKSSSPFTNNFRDCSNSTNYNWYLCHYSYFSSLARSRYLSLFSLSFIFYSVVCRDDKFHYSAGSLFLCLLSLVLVWPRLGDMFVSQNPRELCASYSPGRIRGVPIPLIHMVKFQFLAQLPVDHLDHAVVSSLILFIC